MTKSTVKGKAGNGESAPVVSESLTPVQRFEALKARKTALERQEIELTTRMESAKASYNEELGKLSARYGVKSLSELRDLLEVKKSDFEARTLELEEQLRVYEERG